MKIVEFGDLRECAGMTVGYLGSGTVALSGGSTFAGLFPHWLELSPDSSRTSFFPVDERMVPFEDAQSNWGTAYREFLQPLGRESDKEHFAVSAEAYAGLLRHRFGAALPSFDVIFLGVGDDGHTASLFPGGTYLDDTRSAVLHTISPKPPADRITLGPSVLATASRVVVIVSGVAKKRVVEAIRRAQDDLPIVRILSRRQDSILYLDRRLA